MQSLSDSGQNVSHSNAMNAKQSTRKAHELRHMPPVAAIQRRLTMPGARPPRSMVRKTTVGHLAVALATVAIALPPALAHNWADGFLQTEGLGNENDKRKAVYPTPYDTHAKSSQCLAVSKRKNPSGTTVDGKNLAPFFADDFSSVV